MDICGISERMEMGGWREGEQRDKPMLVPNGISMHPCPSFPQTLGPSQTRYFDKSHAPTSLGTNILFSVSQQSAGM